MNQCVSLRRSFSSLVVLILCVQQCVKTGDISYDLDDIPSFYEAYNQQCGYESKCFNDASCPNLDGFFALERTALEKALAELKCNEEIAKNPALLIGEGEFDEGFFETLAVRKDETLGVRRSLTTDKLLQALGKKYDPCQLKNLLEGRCFANLTLPSCEGATQNIKCDPLHAFRSYDGTCNNLQHPTWGGRGRALKHPIAPCYEDGVLKPARSKSGKELPHNRQLLYEIYQFLQENVADEESSISMFLVFYSELINGDMIGRANKRTCKATTGVRGCPPDGSSDGVRVSPLAQPLTVPADDPYFQQLGVTCLNFSPQERANDGCELKHAAERNLESSYLDLSNLYTDDPQYDKHGRLRQSLCGATEAVVKSEPNSVQNMAIAGLFASLHNYCVERVRQCQGRTCDLPQERCRALTIAVHQKIIYERLLPVLFGEELYGLCGLDCEYNPHVESAVSQAYKSGPGRFQHTWIPEEMAYKPEGGQTEWLPFNVFFHDHEQFDCRGVLEGVIDSPIMNGKLSSAYANKFYTEDGVRGTCLPCIDLARNRDAGLCPLVTFKHYIERLFGDASQSERCYNSFDDLSDMFSPEFCKLLEQYYEHPSDVDVLLSILENRRFPGALLPKLVSQATCLEFKRLKCTDRFFYTWNPYLSEGARHLIEELDFTVLLALFSGMEHVPIEPFFTDSDLVASSEVQSFIETLDYLFCQL